MRAKHYDVCSNQCTASLFGDKHADVPDSHILAATNTYISMSFVVGNKQWVAGNVLIHIKYKYHASKCDNY